MNIYQHPQFRNLITGLSSPHYKVCSDGSIQRFERERQAARQETNLSHLQGQPSLLSSSPEEVDQRVSGGTRSAGFFNSDSLTTHSIAAIQPEEQTVTFSGPNGEEILKLCPNGNIVVNGRLADNDRQVVDGMRQLLGQHNLM